VLVPNLERYIIEIAVAMIKIALAEIIRRVLRGHREKNAERGHSGSPENRPCTI
jgi:hypothetical protein